MIEIKNKNGEVIYTYDGDSLVGADLHGVNLRDANLTCADLFRSDLRGIDIRDADLTGAELSFADISHVDLNGANLYKANLRWADLRCADLRNTKLFCANLCCADLTDAIIDETTKGLNDQCPKNGSFIGYKKCFDENIDCYYIVELEIPEDARRSSATGRKCRCDKAKVLSITNLDGSKADVTEVHSIHKYSFIYKLGEIVEEPNFNDRYWNECASGIHFFMNREDAVDYYIS